MPSINLGFMIIGFIVISKNKKNYILTD